MVCGLINNIYLKDCNFFFVDLELEFFPKPLSLSEETNFEQHLKVLLQI